jgi:hypothetical protein
MVVVVLVSRSSPRPGPGRRPSFLRRGEDAVLAALNAACARMGPGALPAGPAARSARRTHAETPFFHPLWAGVGTRPLDEDRGRARIPCSGAPGGGISRRSGETTPGLQINLRFSLIPQGFESLQGLYEAPLREIGDSLLRFTRRPRWRGAAWLPRRRMPLSVRKRCRCKGGYRLRQDSVVKDRYEGCACVETGAKGGSTRGEAGFGGRCSTQNAIS